MAKWSWGSKTERLRRVMMDRMRRILFTVISGLSLLLLLAVAVVWARSFWIRDIVTYVTDSGEGRMIQSIRGRLHVIMDLSGTSNGGFSHHQDRLPSNAIGNGARSG